MKIIEVLGTGCPKCKKLTEAAEQAAEALGIGYTLEKVTDIEKIMDFGMMAIPALVVDGVVKVSGWVPSVEELKALLGV